MARKSFKNYVKELEVEYHLRIKTLFELNDERLNKIEQLLQKYDLRDIGKPHKTIMQRHPMDFAGIDHGEVWILDVVVGIPCSTYVVRQELRLGLQVNENSIIVRSDNDPEELENDRINAQHDLNKDAEKKGLVPASLLSINSAYDDASQISGSMLYGNEYNSKFLGYLARTAATRKSTEVKPQSPLFDFVEKPAIEADANFNQEIKDAPKSIPWWEALTDDKAREVDEWLDRTGTFSGDKTTYTKTYKDPKTGKRDTITKTTQEIRKKGAE